MHTIIAEINGCGLKNIEALVSGSALGVGSLHDVDPYLHGPDRLLGGTLGKANLVLRFRGEGAPKTHQSWQDLERALAVDVSNFCVIGYGAPGDTIARALGEGRDCLEALDAWKNDAHAALDLAFRFPDQCCIVDVETCWAMPGHFSEVFAARFNRPAPKPDQSWRPDWPDSLLRLAGAELARHMPDCEVLFNKLGQLALVRSASSLTSITDVQRAFVQQNNSRSEIRRAEVDSASARVQALTQSHAELNDTINDLSQQLVKEKAKSEAMTGQLRALQSEYDNYRHASEMQIEAIKQEIGRAQRKTQAVEDQIDRIRASATYKFIRFVSTLLSRPKDWLNSRKNIAGQVRMVADCPLFDRQWYLAIYPDVHAGGWDAAEHYVRMGAKEGRAAGPGFCSESYLSRYSDVQESGVNPLIHYIERGEAEGRKAFPSALMLPEGKE
jgi:uncharacterized coiled-coil protein SlyX